MFYFQINITCHDLSAIWPYACFVIFLDTAPKSALFFLRRNMFYNKIFIANKIQRFFLYIQRMLISFFLIWVWYFLTLYQKINSIDKFIEKRNIYLWTIVC